MSSVKILYLKNAMSDVKTFCAKVEVKDQLFKKKQKVSFEILTQYGPFLLSWIYLLIFFSLVISLKSLYLSNNNLRTVPAEIFMLQNLEYLNLSENRLESINPAHIKLACTAGMYDMKGVYEPLIIWPA